MNRITLTLAAAVLSIGAASSQNTESIPFGQGQLQLRPMADNAVRIRYVETDTLQLPEWIYTSAPQSVRYKTKQSGQQFRLTTSSMTVSIDADRRLVEVSRPDGKVVFRATSHTLTPNRVQDIQAYTARMQAESVGEEHLYGLGQFQDGYADVFGLTRRLTQVNTQISLPMYVSNLGYGLLWNNYGLTDWNPGEASVSLTRTSEHGQRTEVEVTGTEGGRREVREENKFTASLTIPEDGRYALLLDVGQTMARRHHLAIDGQTFIDVANLWLPPTASTIVELTAGTHNVEARLERDDKPTLYFRRIDNTSTLQSPLANAVDYTVFVGSADSVMRTYHALTGGAPLMPRWALGYIHCRERFHSSDEILATAREFRQRHLPVDVMVQDWQYWGKYGWNAMRFDEQFYPNPAALVDSLHRMNMRLMVSVWSKIDTNSEVGKDMMRRGAYIPGTQWIDFFNPDAAQAYWNHFSSRLLKPIGIDAWWQDATEPENDDLQHRRIMNGRYPGELFRNVYSLVMNKTVYEGLRRDDPDRRAMIFTRSAFPGIQRYGVTTWSGDVGNDWQTLRFQLTAGLGMMAAGHPWWTYDAGGFFRPGNQHSNPAYIERMLRWIQGSVYLPVMRVHGYMSDTEPWRYGQQAEDIIRACLQRRYALLPYIYSAAARIYEDGYTLMRPLVFDFPHDAEALQQTTDYMFGPSLLVSPVLEEGATTHTTYLPTTPGGWYDTASQRHYNGGQRITSSVDINSWPVFARAGSIIPQNEAAEYVPDTIASTLILQVYPGADGSYTLYEDEGTNYNYERNLCSRIPFEWNDAKRVLTIGRRTGNFPGMPLRRTIQVHIGSQTVTVDYDGKQQRVKL